MLRTIKSSLFAKAFLLTAVLMMMCCAVTYGSLVSLAPYVYTYSLEEMSELSDIMSMEITEIPRDEVPYFLDFYSNMLSEQSNDECVLRLFRSDGQEVSLANLDEAFDGRLSGIPNGEIVASTAIKFVDDVGSAAPEEFTLVIARNTAKESQVAAALRSAWPILCVIILLLSLGSAFIFARYITKPLKSLSAVSQSMAHLDFSSSYAARRTDEIGILGQNLNELSQKLSAALEELQHANEQLQADIDRERELQRQRSYFFSAASHELKTPVTIIKGQLEGMIHNVGRYKDRDTYLAESLRAVNRLEAMIQELLMATRLEMPESYSESEVLDLGAVVAGQLVLFDDWLTQKNITLQSVLSSRALVCGDPTLVKRVIDNLVSNAVTYSPEGSKITAAVTSSKEGVCFALENTGVHIPDEAIPRLFEAFYRVDESRSQLGGTGLGLYLVKAIIDIHGGEVSISNSADGVLAQVWLPSAENLIERS